MSRIVDCHAHVFRHWQGACGHPSTAVHLRYLQKVVTRPAARAFRARDGLEIKPDLLFREGDGTWAGLTDASFRVGRYGQLEFTSEGEDYYVQYLPVGMQDLTCPPEFMRAQMTVAGVDHCVLQAGGGYGAMNNYNAFAQAEFPAHFTGLLHVDEAMADAEATLAEVDRAVDVLRLRGLYYAQDFSRHGYSRNLDHPAFVPFWEKVVERRLPVFIELSSTPDYSRASYVANLMALDALLTRHPEHPFLLVMGPPVGYFAKDGAWDFPDVVHRVYLRENLQMEVMFPISWGGVWDYPYPQAQELIRGLRDRYGAEKLLWGSDMPNVERFCTYRQCVDYVRKYCTFLSGSEKDRILGDNAARLLQLGAN